MSDLKYLTEEERGWRSDYIAADLYVYRTRLQLALERLNAEREAKMDTTRCMKTGNPVGIQRAVS